MSILLLAGDKPGVHALRPRSMLYRLFKSRGRMSCLSKAYRESPVLFPAMVLHIMQLYFFPRP
ncbi:hypothetical protein Ciccas_003506 [Cichlidogyrus casuarinus]|uniref:Uncharacterized protein n=1 Tax=Cichlidogyrus casuarinus TaxID=1844966 RepID=A0ABD2QE66_9PLAT